MDILGIDYRIWLTLLLVLLVTLLPLAVYLLPIVAGHVISIHRLSRVPLPTIGAEFFLGHAITIANFFRKPKKTNIGTHFFTVMHGMCHMFPNEGIIKFSLGYFLPAVMVYKADTVETVLKHPKEVKKSREYIFASKFFGSGLVTSLPDKWKKHRKLLQPSFHPRILETYQPTLSAKSQRLVDKMKPLTNTKFNCIQELLSNCALDNVCGTSLNYEIGDYDTKTHPLVNSIDVVTSSLVPRITVPWFWPYFIYRFSEFGKRFHSQLKVLIDYSTTIVKHGKVQSNDDGNGELVGGKLRCMPFIRQLLNHKVPTESKDKMCEMDLIDHTRTIAITGYDSPASAMTWATYFLGLYPEVQQKAFEEINTIFNGDTERPITTEDLKKMTYLECVIKESLRVVPIIPLIGRVLEEDLVISGHAIPKGTSVFVMVWTLHRDPNVFPNPEIFDPERFVNRKYPQFAYVPFSAGPRGCIGYMFAFQEMKTVLSNLLRNFQWISLDPFDVVFPSWGNVTVHPGSPVRLALQKRKYE